MSTFTGKSNANLIRPADTHLRRVARKQMGRAIDMDTILDLIDRSMIFLPIVGHAH